MSATNQNQEIDSLKIIEQPDGSFAIEWDKDDQKWNWLNGKTSAEISAIVEEAIQHLMNENDGL
jgi:peroxiredoxin